MKILDCETLKSAEESLSYLFCISCEQLHKHIDELAGMQFEVNADITEDRWLPMLRYVTGHDFKDEKEGTTCWFHATRSHDANSFLAGIGCLRDRLEPTWAFLHTLVADTLSQRDWLRFRREAESGNFGHTSIVVEAWMSNQGPYAFLFADTPLNTAGTCVHDYLGVSELVEFITTDFDRRHPVNLRDRHRAATKPMLVKFATPGIQAMHVGAALDYLIHRKARWPIDCLVPCFSGEGKAVPAEQIVKLIHIEESRDVYRKNPKYRFSDAFMSRGKTV
jgi:hypothetical protein